MAKYLNRAGPSLQLKNLDAIFPGYDTSVQLAYLDAVSHLEMKNKSQATDTVYSIDVVFHIVDSDDIISDSLIKHQLK
jgi:hypothetical protein